MEFKKWLETNEINEDFLPSVKKTGKIIEIKKNKNPIFVHLSNDTKVFLSYDEYKRMKIKPSVGKKMTVDFQRLPTDNSKNPSQINSIKVH